MSAENKIRVVNIIRPYLMGFGRPRIIKDVVKEEEKLTDELQEFAEAQAKQGIEASKWTHGGFIGTIIEDQDNPAVHHPIYPIQESLDRLEENSY